MKLEFHEAGELGKERKAKKHGSHGYPSHVIALRIPSWAITSEYEPLGRRILEGKRDPDH